MGGYSAGNLGGGGGGGGSIPGDTGVPDDIFTVFAEVTAQAAGTFDLPTYTVPAGNYHLMLSEFGGTNVAKYALYTGVTLLAKYATWFAGGLNGCWDFRGPPGGIPLVSGSVLKVTCTHTRLEVGDFWIRYTLLKVN